MLKGATVKSVAREAGADLVGLARVEDYPAGGHIGAPSRFMPGARSIVAFAVRIPGGALESNSMHLTLRGSMTSMEVVDWVGHRVAGYLEDHGALAVAIPTFIPLPMIPETKGLIAEFSLRHAAQAAGLGVLGRNNLLLTERFGPRVRLGAVVTTAELEPDPRAEKVCEECNTCIDSCPAEALSDQGFDPFKCIKNLQPIGLVPAMRFWAGLASKDPEEQKSLIFSPAYWQLHQSLLVGASYNCYLCQKVCPRGRRG